MSTTMNTTLMTTSSGNIVDLTGQKIDLTAWIGWATWWEAALDPGSGITTVYAQPVKEVMRDRVERGPIYRLSFPSVVDTGEGLLEAIANARNAPPGKLAAALTTGEFVLQLQDSSFQHLVGQLAYLEGDHPTDAKGDPSRYWSEHIRAIALTALGAIIPDEHAVIRLNMCMPLTLYTPENKARAMENLDALWHCYVNGIYHELDIRVGTVIPEGYAAIHLYGSPTGRNLAIDIGDRTTEVVAAMGYRIIQRDSDGDDRYGVRQVIEGISYEINASHGRLLEVEEVRALLKAYSADQPLPSLKVPRGTSTGFLDNEALRKIITRKILILARSLAKFIRATINKEGAEIGANLDTATIYGGGAYLLVGPFRDGVKGDPELEHGVLENLQMPPEPEYVNAACMHVMVSQQTRSRPNMWERRR